MIKSSILASNDSPAFYQPRNFSYSDELDRVRKFAKVLARRAEVEVEVDEPNGFQDGSLFTRVLLFSRSGELPGQVLISSFGSLLTTFELVDDELLANIMSAAGDCGYTYVASESLLSPYDGEFDFKGMTWLDRFFSAFYFDPRML